MDNDVIRREQLEALLELVECELGIGESVSDESLDRLSNMRTRQILKEFLNRKYKRMVL